MRRRRNNHANQEAERQARQAGNRRASYQSDALARSTPAAYEEYEIYEEYEELPSSARQQSSVVIPAVTLPSVPSLRTPNAGAQPTGSQPRGPAGRRGAPGAARRPQPEARQISDPDSWLNEPATPPRDGPSARAGTTLGPRAASHRQRLTRYDRLPPSAVPAGRVRRMSRRIADVVVIPVARHALPRPVRSGIGHILGAVGGIARRPMVVSALVLVVVLLGVLANITGVAQQASVFSASAWHALAGLGPSTNAGSSGPLSAPASYDARHYIDKYGFFQPGAPTPIASDESARLAQMLPAAIKATAAYDRRYSQSVEPQMLLYWTHSEGIRARINYSNCANENTRAGTTYNSDIENCDHASFWQLGYGNQFGVIYVLRNAFTDLYGDPNDTRLVAKVGQWVLDFDKQQGTTPPCGGYSCTFPAKTIDDILTGINLKTGVMAEDNWWASVLSRDPAINCYMIAHALTYFSHDATRSWVGCYYAAPCWQRDSDKLGDILAAWPDLLKAAGVQG